MKRILILDWDVHHGNVLSDLFYDRKSVLYVSTHDPGLYPYSGDWEQTGAGRGEGYTVNLPLPRGLNDKEFLHIFDFQVRGKGVGVLSSPVRFAATLSGRFIFSIRVSRTA